ncbi:MAG: gamma carbonic anhydrase family protein [Betaproteobacteria bacterium]|nr:gamma carbonic anhydrase family protein [Betaproteobacteria bacterium]
MDHLPQMDGSVWWHHSAQIIGQVSIRRNSSIWCGAVIRGDVNSISIGERTNIQDNSVLHVSHPTPSRPDGAALFIGNDVTVGHSCILHGCYIADASLIGMGCIVMDNACIESEVLLGAGSLVPEGQILQSGYLYLGRPAKRIRPLTDEEIAYLYYSAQHYMQLAVQYHGDANRV